MPKGGGVFSGNGDGGILGAIFGRFKQSAGDYANSVGNAIMPWMQRLSGNLLPKVGATIAQGRGCESRNVSGGRASPCHGEAAVLCEACRKYVCMGHAFISWRADAVCWECVAKACQASGHGGAPSGDNGEAPPREDAGQDQIAAAHKVLGVSVGADFDDIKKAYRKLAAKWHPDQFQEAEAKAKAERKIKVINNAFSFLKKLHERAEA